MKLISQLVSMQILNLNVLKSIWCPVLAFCNHLLFIYKCVSDYEACMCYSYTSNAPSTPGSCGNNMATISIIKYLDGSYCQ